MSHEQSETIQRPDGKWINVYGMGLPLAGQQLPGSGEFDNVNDAVSSAIARSKSFDHTHKDDMPGSHKDTSLALPFLNDPAYTPLDQIGGAGMGGPGNDSSYALPGNIEQRVNTIEELSNHRRNLEDQLMAVHQAQQAHQGGGMSLGDLWQGVKNAGSSGLDALGRGVNAITPSQDTMNNVGMRLQNMGAAYSGQTPLYMKQLAMQQDMQQNQQLFEQRRQTLAADLEHRKEQKRQHDIGLLERAMSHPKAPAVLEQLSADPQFSLAKQAGMLSKSLKDADYGSLQAYKEFIPEEVQQRLMDGSLPHHELTSWIDMAREDAKHNAKANAKQAVLSRAISKNADQRTPFERSLVEEHEASLETKKLKDEETRSKTAENYAQAAKYKNEAEGDASKVSPIVDSLAHAFHGVGYKKLPEGGPEQRDVMNRYSQLYAQGRNAVDLGSPATVDKRSDVVSKRDFLEKGSLNRPPAGISKGQLAAGDYIQMSDAQQKQSKEIEMAKANLTSMFDLITPHITAKGPVDAAGQYAKLQAGALSGMNPDAATYKAGSEAFSSVFSRVFGGEVGVMTDRDIARWQATLPTFGDTTGTMKKKKELFFKIYDEAVSSFRRSVAGDSVDKKNMQGLLSQADALKGDAPSSKQQSQPSVGGPYQDPAKEKRYQEWLKKQGK
jgi:hypothetical protein